MITESLKFKDLIEEKPHFSVERRDYYKNWNKLVNHLILIFFKLEKSTILHIM